MTKILLIGDPHLQINRFNIGVQLLTWICELVEKHKPDLVVNLGDTFHNHAVLRSELLYEFKKHVLRCTETCPYIYVLGNHDCYLPNSSEYHALQSFNLDNFVVVADTQEIDGITYVPYIPKIEDFPTLNKTDIMVAHQTFVGADYGYYRPDVGVDADKIAADIIISGHVHMRQSFGKVYYPGTPVAYDLNDIDQVKGISIFDTATYEFEFIESPFPQFKSLSYAIAGDFSIDDMHQDLTDTINSKHNWIVKLNGDKPEIVEYMKSKKWLNLQKEFNIRLKPEFTTGDKVQRVKISAVSFPNIVNEYFDKVYSGSLDKKMLKLKAKQFIDKAMKSNV